MNNQQAAEDWASERAEQLLPCHGLMNQADCPCNHRKAVAAALREARAEGQQQGREEGYAAGFRDAKVAAKAILLSLGPWLNEWGSSHIEVAASIDALAARGETR